MEDNKFTNKEELEYPTEDDFVDVKVLNNNTRLLSEKKADIADIEVSLQGVAKERIEYSIEDKVKELDTKIQKLEDIEKRKAWLGLPNLRMKQYNETIMQSTFKEKEILSISGGGHLIISTVRFSYNASNSKPNKMKLKIQIDGETIYDVSIIDNYTDTGGSRFPKLGIINDTEYTSLTKMQSKDINGNEKIYRTLDIFGELVSGTMYPLHLTYNLSQLSLPIVNKTFNVEDYQKSTLVGTNDMPVCVAVCKEAIRFNKSLKIIVAYDSNPQVLGQFFYSLDN